MVDIKVGGPATVKGPEKKKPAGKTGSTGGPSFASLLDSATAASETTPTIPTTFSPTIIPLPTEEDQGEPAPRNPREQAENLLDKLQTLAEESLTGSPADIAAKLEAYLKHDAPDRSTLSPEAQQALDELQTRAAVAAAKAKP